MNTEEHSREPDRPALRLLALERLASAELQHRHDRHVHGQRGADDLSSRLRRLHERFALFGAAGLGPEEGAGGENYSEA